MKLIIDSKKNSGPLAELQIFYGKQKGLFLTKERTGHFSVTHCREIAGGDFDDLERMWFVIPSKQISLKVFFSRVAKWLGVKASVTPYLINGKYNAIEITANSGFWGNSILGNELFTLFCRSYQLFKNTDVKTLKEWGLGIQNKDLFKEEVLRFILNFKTLSKHLDALKIIDDYVGDIGGLCDSLQDEEKFYDNLFGNLTLEQKIKLFTK